MRPKTDTLSVYNQLWGDGKIKEPLSILIGGNIGTGKSTFAHLLTEHLHHVNIISTGIIRSIIQTMNTQSHVPEIYRHSYQLGKLSVHPSIPEIQKAIRGFEKQRLVIDKTIRKILKFSKTEGQQFIIDGNHVMARTIAELKKTPNIIGLFFKTSNVNQYRVNVTGPTHQRQLTEKQFKIALALHNHLVAEAIKYGIPLFEYKEQNEALKYVASQVEIIIDRKNL